MGVCLGTATLGLKFPNLHFSCANVKNFTPNAQDSCEV